MCAKHLWGEKGVVSIVDASELSPSRPHADLLVIYH